MTKCPTPWKIPFQSRREAITSVVKGRSFQKMKGQVRPYHCECGSWHLSTMNKHTARKVKQRKDIGDGHS